MMEEVREEKSNPSTPFGTNSPSPLKQIRTFQGDVAEALKKQRESLVSIQQAQHLKRGRAESSASAPRPNSKKRMGAPYLLLASSALFVMGAIGVWYAYQEFVRKTTTPMMAAPANRFVIVNTEINLDLTSLSRDTLIGAFAGAAENVAQGEFRHIIARKVIGEERVLLSTGEFLEILGSRASGSLVRAFNPLFMSGVFGESVFLIIKLASFENAFAGMLAWEQHLAQDIGPLFATSELLRNLSSESVFTDTIDRNKDIRMLTFEEQPILLYSFFDNNMLIITDDIETLRSLIDRLNRAKLSR